MAVEIAFDPKRLVAVMWCNTTDHAFGPVFTGPSADAEAQEFMDWLAERGDPVSWAVASPQTGDGSDPRDFAPDELERVVKFWREQVGA